MGAFLYVFNPQGTDTEDLLVNTAEEIGLIVSRNAISLQIIDHLH